MINSLETFYVATVPVITAFDAWVAAASPAARADHLGYKCADAVEFEKLRALFEYESAFIYQSIISARRIAVIKLSRAISTALGEITTLELSDQKPDGSQRSGFDHIEIFPTEGTVEALGKSLATKNIHFEKTVRPHHTTYDTTLDNGFKVRLESEPLIEKIKRQEMFIVIPGLTWNPEM